MSTSSLISPYYFGDPTIFDKGVSPKEDPKLSFEGNKVHTLLKLFQGESSKQDSVKFEGVLSFSLVNALIAVPQVSPRASKRAHTLLKEKEKREQ